MATYSFLNIQATITGPGGSFSLGSDAGSSDEGLTVVASEDKNTQTIGAGGEVMNSLHAGKPGTMTFRYLQTSAVNAALSAMYNLQVNNPALHGQNVLTVRDTARGDIHTGVQVAFKKFPDAGYAKEGGTREWVFDVGVLNMQFGSGTPSVNV